MQLYYYLEVDLPVEIESDIESKAFELFKCQGVDRRAYAFPFPRGSCDHTPMPNPQAKPVRSA